jgi:hypothetical protein
VTVNPPKVLQPSAFGDYPAASEAPTESARDGGRLPASRQAIEIIRLAAEPEWKSQFRAATRVENQADYDRVVTEGLRARYGLKLFIIISRLVRCSTKEAQQLRRSIVRNALNPGVPKSQMDSKSRSLHGGTINDVGAFGYRLRPNTAYVRCSRFTAPLSSFCLSRPAIFILI